MKEQERQVIQRLVPMLSGWAKGMVSEYSVIETLQQYLKIAGYVRLSLDQSLPEKDKLIMGTTWEQQSKLAYEQAQQDMLKAGFKKIDENRTPKSD